MKVNRPWGNWEVLSQAKGFKVKTMEVSPGKRLSLQKHKQRIEHWVVLEGEAKVTSNDKIIILSKDQYISIGKNIVHRVENCKNETLKILEIQIGSYLEEDDIQRLEDDYGRL